MYSRLAASKYVLSCTFLKADSSTSPGSLTPVQFDETVRDLVNFLVYMGEPAATSRKQIGIFVLLFLLAMWPLAYLLKREFWKDVH